jgi:lysophospholipase L1-like esterase
MNKIRRISLVAAFLLVACSPLKNYRDLPELKIWEPEIVKFENLDKIESYPSSPVFWIEITPTSSRWKVWPQVTRANDLIWKECENHRNTYFISTSSAFLNEKGLPKDELFRDDKLHLNADGYKVWTVIIKDELNKVLNK